MRSLPPCWMQYTDAGLAIPTLGWEGVVGACGAAQALNSKAVVARLAVFFMVMLQARGKIGEGRGRQDTKKPAAVWRSEQGHAALR